MPKLIVGASRGYYEEWRDVWILRHPGWLHPSFEEVRACSHKIQEIWDKRRGDELLEKIAAITGIKWQRPEIRCYIIGKHKSSWSEPMTISTDVLEMGEEYCLGDLIHEAIHILIKDGCEDWIDDYLSNEFPGESDATKIHIFVHTIHFGLGHDAGETHLAHNPDYKRSWEIIRSQGYENILKGFRAMVREKS